MLKRPILFLLAFGIGVASFVVLQRPVTQIAASLTITVVYALFAAADGSVSEEEADATYFLGFLLTLGYLAFGLYRLANTSGTSVTEAAISRFIGDLGVGLSFTVIGLFVRQWLILSKPEIFPAASPPAVSERVAASGPAMPDVPDVEKLFEQQIERSGRRLSEAMNQLERVAGETAARMSTVGISFHDTMRDHVIGRLQQEMTAFVTAFKEENARLLQSLKDSTSAVSNTSRTVSESFSTFEQSLQRTRDAAGSLGALVGQLNQDIEGLPKPTDRILSLWQGLTDAERKIVDAANTTAGALNDFQRSTGTSQESLTSLRSELEKTGRAFSETGNTIRVEIKADLERTRAVVEEFYGILNEIIAKNARR